MKEVYELDVYKKDHNTIGGHPWHAKNNHNPWERSS
jgi:hypothetical protein